MDRAGRKRRAAGFTLIEMLLVITIIMILVAILVAAVVTRSPGRTATVKIMQQLHQELEAYYALYQAYPPSKHGSMSGAECLYYYLLGPNGKGWTLADGVPRGFTSPPSSFPGEWLAEENGKKFFWDGYGDHAKAILYYRADPSPSKKSYNQVYNSGDNSGLGEFGWNPGGDWAKMIRDPRKPDNRPYNENSYILLSAGNDREFGFDGDRTDDLMNFARAKDD